MNSRRERQTFREGYTGLRVHELAGISRERIEWEARRLSLIGKGRKRRVVPLTDRVLRLLEHHFAISDNLPFSVRGVQRLVKRVANLAGIAREVTRRVLRHSFAGCSSGRRSYLGYRTCS